MELLLKPRYHLTMLNPLRKRQNHSEPRSRRLAELHKLHLQVVGSFQQHCQHSRPSILFWSEFSFGPVVFGAKLMLCRLEKPCLPHVKFRYLTGYTPPSCATGVIESNAGPGHVFTATASLLNDHCDEQPPERPFAVSPEEIDRLFRTSLSLELGPDCTPIQIWANLIRISSRYPINNNMLRVLVDEFSKYIRCNRSVCSAYF